MLSKTKPRIAGEGVSRTQPLPVEPVGERRTVVVYAEAFMYTEVDIQLAENERIIGVEHLSSGHRHLWIERTK